MRKSLTEYFKESMLEKDKEGNLFIPLRDSARNLILYYVNGLFVRGNNKGVIVEGYVNDKIYVKMVDFFKGKMLYDTIELDSLFGLDDIHVEDLKQEIPKHISFEDLVFKNASFTTVKRPIRLIYDCKMIGDQPIFDSAIIEDMASVNEWDFLIDYD